MLRLALLGSPEISLHGQSLTEQITGRGFALLAYLAVTGESHTRETLAELLCGTRCRAFGLGLAIIFRSPGNAWPLSKIARTG
jgi:hypothetical protein